MAFFDKLNQVAKNLGEMTNDALETTKQNSKINAEKTAAGEDLKKIGEYYYNLYITTGEAAPEIIDFCNSAKAHYDEAAKAQAEIDRIKAENEAAKAPVAPPVTPVVPAAPAPAAGGAACPTCGAANPTGTKFCSECGSKLEIPAPPQEKTCPACGAVAAPGVRFCSECGQRLEG